MTGDGKPRRVRRWRSAVVALVVCGLFGLVASVAVSWGLAVHYTNQIGAGINPLFKGGQALAAPFADWYVQVHTDTGRETLWYHPGAYFEKFGPKEPGWATAIRTTLHGPPATAAAYGWPRVCFARAFVSVQEGARGKRLAGIPAPSWVMDVPGRGLPALPIWSGLVIDSAAWGAMPFAIFLAWRGARRFAWRRAGACAACGYSRAGLSAETACPECGAIGGEV